MGAAQGQSPAAQGGPLQGNHLSWMELGLFPADRLGMPALGVDEHAGRSVNKPRLGCYARKRSRTASGLPGFQVQKPVMRPRKALRNMRATPMSGQNLLLNARKSPRKLAGNPENLTISIWVPTQTAAGEGAIGPVEALFRVGRDPNECQVGPQ